MASFVNRLIDFSDHFLRARGRCSSDALFYAAMLPCCHAAMMLDDTIIINGVQVIKC
jgi:hypothetical protein